MSSNTPEYNRAYYQAHREKTVERARAWRRANQEKAREAARKSVRKWRDAHPEEAARKDAANYRRRAMDKVKRILEANFTGDGYLLTLDFTGLSFRPARSVMRSEVERMIRRLRADARGAGEELRYIYTADPAEGPVVRLLVNEAGLDFANGPEGALDRVARLWQVGGVHIVHADRANGWGGLLELLTPGTAAGGRSWVRSRNMREPVED